MRNIDYNKLRFTVYYVVTGSLLFYMVSLGAMIAAGVMVALIILGLLIQLFPDSGIEDIDDGFYDEKDEPHLHTDSSLLVYHGHELDFSSVDLDTVLDRHSVFYSSLDADEKKRFIERLRHFIRKKTFRIYDRSGFREMPILISASAIQVSFGLDEFLLAHFSTIDIHPDAFLRLYPGIRFLEGNVSGKCISISWKYFLEGFQYPQDGKNVGLHEMAHAYYYQNFGPCADKDGEFIKGFSRFDEYGSTLFPSIQRTAQCVYSDYGKKNFQEFWAESVELFFEKPMELRTAYPGLYECIADVLNQDPLKPVI